jgi:hypothetical protein
MYWFKSNLPLKRKKKLKNRTDTSQINFNMPQFSPYWFINIISWSFSIIAFLVWYNQAIILPAIIRLNLSRTIKLMNS